MKETGLMFKAPLVRAILDDLKTQTRRIAKLPHMNPLGEWEPTTVGGPGGGRTRDGKEVPLQIALGHTRTGDVICAPIQPGDRIYVRETFVQGYEYDAVTDRLRTHDAAGKELPMKTWFRATETPTWCGDDGWEVNTPWKPAIHMPKSLARIWLEVTGVRAERLQDISNEDAIAEGVNRISHGREGDYYSAIRNEQHPKNWTYPDDAFRELWESTGGDWAANPWVWVIDFKRIDRRTTA